MNGNDDATAITSPDGTTDDTPPVELTITGRLDHAVVPKLGAMFDAAIERRQTRIVLDVTQCHYADAAGIALLLDLHRRSRRAGGGLTLRAPSPRLRRLFEIARVDRVLDVEAEPPPSPGDGPPGGDVDADLARSPR